jgi:glycine/D-amino acid oxidase-like deaminating enzyme/nitrite reductase/ring-hydroxylating ferredoxin subunit
MREGGPIWFRGVRRTTYAPLDQDRAVDVAIAGGGITGLTAAVLLASAGRDVVVLEADRIASGTTGGTSAHVTEVPDRGYRALLRQAGERSARALVDRSRAALTLLASLAQNIECDFSRVPAYLFSENPDEHGRLEEECRAAADLGRPAELLADVPLPWRTAGGVRFADQAAMHPVRYVLGLARLATERGATVCEATPVVEFVEQGGEVRIGTPHGDVRAHSLLLATHTPLGFNLVQTEVAPYRSYILAVELQRPLAAGVFWDTSDPYFYLRRYDDQGTPLALVGGADHKTGHEHHPETRFSCIEDYVRARCGAVAIRQRWSAQLYEPADGLPYIGRAPGAQRVYLATGFSGVGLVQGTMAAMELAAALRGESCTDAFAATRLTVGALPRFLAENVDVATRWIGDRLAGSGGDAAEIAAGEGRIVRLDGERRAVYRGEDGALHVLSPVCPHMGCIVRWNSAERSWDCPCHGARYAATGERLEGPALSGLTRISETSRTASAAASSSGGERPARHRAARVDRM